VKSALNIQIDSDIIPSDDVIIDFPFSSNSLLFSAKVVFWNSKDDVAGLKLQEAAPDDTENATFVAGSALSGHAVRALGFPPGFAAGVWSAGQIFGKTATNRLQIGASSEVGYGIQSGFSGSPVFDLESGGVIGIVAARDLRGGTAFVIPSETLTQLWGSVTLTPPSRLPPQVKKNVIQVFLCHASDDKPAVRDLYGRLQRDGFRPWFDEHDILPGQQWESEIRKAVRRSNAILICLSQRSTNKSGYVQKELRFALDIADEKPDDVIFLIPVRLENCTVPDRLQRFQWVNLYSEDGYERLTASLRIVADTGGRPVT
jgi:hypothetical protein